MVSSIDGATTVAGRSGALGGAGDRMVFAAIRGVADVVLAGAETVRVERYGPPARPGLRIAVVTRSGRLDWEAELFRSGTGLVVAPEDGPDVPVPVVRAGLGSVDLAGALRRLAADGVGVVLAEGGPTLNGQLLAAGLVDELCVTVAPVAVGGSADRLAVGPDVEAPPWRLAHVLEHEGELFLRYLRA